jgi:ABC-2 type transport system permease protein
MSKALTDTWVVFQIEALKFRVWLPFYLFSIFVAPVGLLLFAKALTPPGFDVGTRLMTGSLVFGLGIMTVNNMAQIMAQERFTFQLKLVVASPVHRLSYAGGVVAYSVMQAAVTAVVVMGFAPIFGIDIHLSPWLVPLILLTTFSMTGIAVTIATWSPAWEVGNILANVMGLLVTLLSPVYYPIERLPEWLRWVARFSPYTHAGEAINRVLSGQGGFEREALVLAAITLVGLAIGVAGLRWREA